MPKHDPSPFCLTICYLIDNCQFQALIGMLIAIVGIREEGEKDMTVREFLQYLTNAKAGYDNARNPDLQSESTSEPKSKSESKSESTSEPKSKSESKSESNNDFGYEPKSASEPPRKSGSAWKNPPSIERESEPESPESSVQFQSELIAQHSCELLENNSFDSSNQTCRVNGCSSQLLNRVSGFCEFCITECKHQNHHAGHVGTCGFGHPTTLYQRVQKRCSQWQCTNNVLEGHLCPVHFMEQVSDIRCSHRFKCHDGLKCLYSHSDAEREQFAEQAATYEEHQPTEQPTLADTLMNTQVNKPHKKGRGKNTQKNVDMPQ